MTATTHDDPVGAYLESVGDALADLSPAERDDLLGEVGDSVRESAREGGASLEARLGPPAAFAAELRAAAGLPPAAAGESPGTLDAVRGAIRSIASSRRAGAALRTARELAPVWWVARGYVAVAALSSLAGDGWPQDHPFIPYVGSQALSVVLLVAAVCGSVWLGLRRRGGRSGSAWPLAVANLVLLVAAIPVAAHLLNPAVRTELVVSQVPAPLDAGTGITTGAGIAVTNIYPYSRDGRLLLDVRLFDQEGAPLDLAGADPTRRVLRTLGGRRILNSFPIRYRDPATGRVTHPTAGPAVVAPKIITPALTPGAP